MCVLDERNTGSIKSILDDIYNSGFNITGRILFINLNIYEVCVCINKIIISLHGSYNF